MLMKEICVAVYEVHYPHQDVTVPHMPAEYWQDFEFCVTMMDISSACLPYCPIPTRRHLRHLHNCQWLYFEDEIEYWMGPSDQIGYWMGPSPR